MQTYNFGNLEEFLKGWSANQPYFEMLKHMAQLSKLFSENDIPYLDYRLAENLFCRNFPAMNDARSCTAYDARINKIGIGIKTFCLTTDYSTEKIAEFNQLKPQLEGLKDIDLARKLGEFRNDRMRLANDTYDVNETQYHIVSRNQGGLRIFNTPYEEVNIESIGNVKDSTKSISFDDGLNEYTFNKSKSVLQKRFYLPKNYVDIEVNLLEDPYVLIEQLFVPKHPKAPTPKHSRTIKGVDYVVLPLYSTRDKNVQPKAGLNQWNAGGRKRHEDEVYIPVPASIHKNYPQFFPQTNEETFVLILPNGKQLSAKMCQSGLKGLMSNPNKELGHWILRTVLKKKPGELVTMQDLYRYGIDSVYVEKHKGINEYGQRVYSISFSNDYEKYEEFIE